MTALLERPIYPSAEAARLVGVNPSRAHRWLRGYSYKYIRKNGVVVAGKQKPVVHRPETGETPYASFLELIDLLFVTQFLEEGVKLPKLRKALEEASQILGTAHFAHEIFFTDGSNIALKVKEEGDAIMGLLDGGQYLIPSVIEELSKRIEFHDHSEVALRWYPSKGSDLVVVDPAIAFGNPSIVNRGISTATIHDLFLAENKNMEQVCDWMELSEEQVNAAIAYEESLAA